MPKSEPKFESPYKMLRDCIKKNGDYLVITDEEVLFPDDLKITIPLLCVAFDEIAKLKGLSRQEFKKIFDKIYSK